MNIFIYGFITWKMIISTKDICTNPHDLILNKITLLNSLILSLLPELLFILIGYY